MKIGFLLSGSGSTLENLIGKMKELNTPADICVVISSKDDAYGLTRAKNNSIPARVVEYAKYKNDVQSYSTEITKTLKQHGAQFVVMGGFMSYYIVPLEYENKIINVHPALIPAFCGKNMYGRKVHEAVYKSGVKVTGCTVHFVNNEYDAGPIIAQKSVDILPVDTVDTISEKVVQAEREIYPVVVDAYCRGRVEKFGGRFFVV